MAYVVMERVNGLGRMPKLAPPVSRTAVWPGNSARVAAAQQAAGGWRTPEYGTRSFQSLRHHGIRGLGSLGVLDNVPQWAVYAGGGVAAGVVLGWLFLKK